MIKLILSYLPVHLISPTLNSPDTLIKHFSHSPSGKYPCCLSRTSGTNYQAAQVPFTPVLQFSNRQQWQARVGGRAGDIRCTGRYDNISFIIKTLYWHTQPVHLISPINNIYWRREALRHGTGSNLPVKPSETHQWHRRTRP